MSLRTLSKGAMAPLLLALLASCSKTQPPPAPITTTGLAISLTSTTLPKGTSLPISVSALRSNSTKVDCTSSAFFQMSNSAVATVAGLGNVFKLTAVSEGTTTLNVSCDDVSASTVITVSPATLTTLQIDNVVPVAMGTTLNLAANGTFSDTTHGDVTMTATWSSSAPAVATVEAGVVHGLTQGTATITATAGSVTATATVTVTAATPVSLRIDPSTLDLAIGITTNLHATSVMTDGSTTDSSAQATWSSSNIAAATISSTGGAHGVALGTTTVTATVGTMTATCAVNVSAAIPTAIVVSASGDASVAAGRNLPLLASATMSDGTNADVTADAVWSTSNHLVLTVGTGGSTAGVATGVIPGSATVTATIGNASGNLPVTVTDAVVDHFLFDVVSPVSLAAGLGKTVHATAVMSDRSRIAAPGDATWTSSDDTVASISNDPATVGQITSHKEGTATLTLSLDAASSTLDVKVTPAVLQSLDIGAAKSDVPIGLDLPLDATGTYSDGTTSRVNGVVLWSSSDRTIATVDNAGKAGTVHGVALGSATIHASAGSLSGTYDVTVSPPVLSSIKFTVPTLNMPEGNGMPVTVTGIYSDGSKVDMTDKATFSTSDDTVVSMADDGVTLNANGQGNADVTATIDDFSSKVSVRVLPGTPDYVNLNPNYIEVPNGTEENFTATAGYYFDGSEVDMTYWATWSSDDYTFVFSGAPGHGTCENAGATWIDAQLGDYWAETWIYVD